MNWLGLILLLVICCAADALAVQHRPAPTLTARLESGGRVSLNWPGSSDRLCLERRLATEDLFHTIAEFSAKQRGFVDSTLPPNSSCAYRLRPYAARYLDQYGPELTVTTELPPPATPRLDRVGISSVRVSLPVSASWATPVVVEHRSAGLYQFVGTLSASSPACIDSGLAVNQYHFYRGRSISGGITGPASPVDSLYLDLIPPTSVSANPLNDQTVLLSWQSRNSFSASHELERMASGQVRRMLLHPGAVAYVDSALSFNQSVYYRVRARSGLDSSDWTAAVQVYLQPLPVTRLSVDPVHDESVWLSWSHVDSLPRDFTIERSINTGPFLELARVGARTMGYADRSVPRGAIYRYRIVSHYSNGATAISAEVRDSIPEFTTGMVRVSDNIGVFYVDAAEVTVAGYLEFLRERVREVPDDPGFSDHPNYWSTSTALPAVNVAWFDAMAYCNWRSAALGLTAAYDSTGNVIPGADGFRLLTREHFLRALRSVSGSTDAPLFAGTIGSSSPQPAQPGDSNGIQNLLGNVWEWTEDPVEGTARLIIGGAYSTPPAGTPPPEFCYRPDYASPTIGFRCMLIR